jgi:hypothetical protein
MGKLEKIVSSAKKHWKEIVTAIALPFIINNSAKADYCRIDCMSVETNSPWIAVAHINGASEGHDGKDVDFLQSPHSPRIDFYSKVPLSYPYDDKLKVDARGANSTTYFDIKIEGAEIPESIDANLSFLIWNDGQGNFSWKNLIAELYNSGDVNEPNNLISTYDMKYMDRSNGKIPLIINNLLSYQLLIKFFNHADLNRDRKVNGLDFAIFARNWGGNEETDPNTFGSYVGSEPNNLGAYADIDRNGIVDINDLSTFSGEWLWDANDPNTWSRVR